MQALHQVPPIRSGLPDIARIGERYQDLTEIGRGGLSVVCRARDTVTGGFVAIKSPKADKQPEGNLAIAIELEALSRIKHPNVVGLLASEIEGGNPFLVLEYITGSNLRRNAIVGLPKSKVLDILLKLTGALSAIHNAGVIHRDLKLDNIMITENERVVLFDFGAASGPGLPELPKRYATVRYMAPEISSGDEIGITADIYSLGIIGYELLSGEVPFSGDSSGEVIEKHISQPPPLIAELRPELDVPLCVEAIFIKALAKNPRDRFQYAAEIQAELIANKQWFEEK